MNCVLPVLLVLICLTFTKQEDSVGKVSSEIVINNQTEKLPNSDVIDVSPEPDYPTNGTETTTNTSPTTTTTPSSTTATSTTTPSSTTATSTTKSSSTTATTTTATTTTKPPPPTTKTSTISPPTTTKPTISPPTTTSTLAPTTSTASPEHHRRFDGPSFVGGIVLALGLVAIGFVAFKFYKARIEVNYHTL